MARSMKRSVIEQKLNEAMQRKDDARREDWRLTDQIEHHDREASRIRKERQKYRNKMQRADDAINKYGSMLSAIVNI